jgi:hypothetical protein
VSLPVENDWYSGRHPAAARGDVLAGLLALGVILVYASFIFVLASWRDVIGYGTETDFIGSMLQDARRLLAGEPMAGEFHPPAFSMLMAGVYALVGDWFVAGKLIASVSAMVVLVATWWLFRMLCGPWVALGAVLGLASSVAFLNFSAQATSDAYFLALFSLASLMACVAALRGSPGLWLAAGVLIGLGLMTRTNGLTQVLLVAIPLFQSADLRYKLTAVGGAGLGIVLVLAAFFAFAALTGANLFPKGTYHNLAMTYFTDERVSWEGMLEARTRFDSLTDVLLHDPAAIVRGYVRDLYNLVTFKGIVLSGPLLALLFLPGLIYLVADHARIPFLVFLLAMIAQVLLVNFKAFEARYFLFLAPWIGAGCAYLGVRFARDDWRPLVRFAAVAVVAVLFLASLGLAANKAVQFARDANGELAEALPVLLHELAARDAIVSRKPHIGYYTGAADVFLPAAIKDEAELREFMSGISARTDGDVYLFYGRIERQFRVELEQILDAAVRPDWLEEVASGSGRHQWSLYRYAPQAVPAGLIPAT